MYKKILLIIYYGFANFLPMQPFPGYTIYYKIRYFLISKILRKTGKHVIVKNKVYFGDGSRLEIGDRSQLGQNARLQGRISIGQDVLMGPDVVMMATSHEFKNLEILINMQGEAMEKKIIIGNNVWIGTRVIILPGVVIEENCIIGAGSVVTKSFPKNAIIAGNPAKIIKMRV